MSDNKIIYQQIRNATVKITYHGQTFLVDPYFRPKGEDGCFQIAPKPELKKLKNPLVELPMPIKEIIKDINAVVLSHTHGDHWDDVAAKNIPKSVPVFVQNNSDQNLLKSQGFTDVRIVGHETLFNGITITKTEEKHGTDDVIPILEKNVNFVWDLFLEHLEKKLCTLLEILFGLKILKSLLKHIILTILS